jgi:hypothetical protein
MLLLFLLLAVSAVLAVGAGYQWHVRRHLPYDLREVGPEGLPNEASIRSGELGMGTASQTFRNL